jgi:hypothetical protein
MRLASDPALAADHVNNTVLRIGIRRRKLVLTTDNRKPRSRNYELSTKN